MDSKATCAPSSLSPAMTKSPITFSLEQAANSILQRVERPPLSSASTLSAIISNKKSPFSVFHRDFRYSATHTHRPHKPHEHRNSPKKKRHSMKTPPKHRSPNQQLTNQNLRDTPSRACKEFLERLLGPPALLLRRFPHFFSPRLLVRFGDPPRYRSGLSGDERGGRKKR